MPLSSDSLPAEDIAAYLAFATRLAETAGAITRRYFRSDLTVDNKRTDGKFDPVTAADREAETAIRRLIADTYPGHGLHGEEHGLEKASSPFTWVIDPIDGTRSFIAGVPLWGTLIALNDGARPVIGLMDQPYIGEMFVGWPGGAELRTRDGARPLKTKTTARLEDALLGCTDPAMFAGKEQTAFQTLEQRCRFRRYGGDCYFYGLLAAGFFDLIVESGLHAYDIQALMPIIEGAGGIVTGWNGGDPQQGGQIIAAANAGLHAQALDVLRPAALA